MILFHRIYNIIPVSNNGNPLQDAAFLVRIIVDNAADLDIHPAGTEHFLNQGLPGPACADDHYPVPAGFRTAVVLPVYIKPQQPVGKPDSCGHAEADNISHNIIPTSKEDLYIRPPSIPRFDISSPYLDKIINNTHYTIYRSLPEVPITQSQISVTTDIDRMTDMDLLRLYPNTFIRTRSATMYESHSNMELDEDIGVIFPICNYTADQIKDNIIRYPHIFKLMRMIDNKIVSFYSNIEIDGVLYNTLEIWDTLPDSKYIPRNSEFIKEYVVRRYLLERDIDKIDHKYPIFGALDPFLTLFTTKEDYIRMGYRDTLNIARQCVISRVNYKQSRNPILRMVNNE